MKFLAVFLLLLGCLCLEGHAQKSKGTGVLSTIKSIFQGGKSGANNPPKPTGGMPSGSKPSGGMPAGGSKPRPTGGMPTGGRPSGGAPTGGNRPRPTGGMPAGGRPSGGMPTGANPRPTGGMPSGGMPTGGNRPRPTGGIPPGGRPSGGMPTGSNVRPTGRVPSGGMPTGGNVRPTGRMPSGGMPTRGMPTGGMPTGGSRPRPTGRIPTGGRPSGGMPTGGNVRPTGGMPSGGMPSGGNVRPTGRMPSGGMPTRGMPTGGSRPRPTGRIPTGGRPSGGMPTGGNVRPTGRMPSGGMPTGGNVRPTGRMPSGGMPTGGNVRPTGRMPSGGMPTGGNVRPTGRMPSGGIPSGGNVRPTGRMPSGGIPTGGNVRPTGRMPTGGFSIPRGGITMPPRQKKVYKCPRECPICQALSNPASKTKACMAFDEYGDSKPEFERSLSRKQNSVFQELKDLDVFTANMNSRTCEGMKFHIRIYDSMDRATKDKLKEFIQDPSSVSPAIVKKFPKEVFSSLNERNGTEVFKRISNDQKVVLCEDLKYADCLTREAIKKKVDCAKALINSGKTVRAKDAASLMDLNNCSSWDNSDWTMTFQNFPEILKADCLKEAPADKIFENMEALSKKCTLLGKREIKILANITSEKIREKRTNGRMQAKEKNDYTKLMSKCGANPKYLKNTFGAKETLKNADLSRASKAEKMKFVEEAMRTMKPEDFSKDEIVNSFDALVNDRKTLRKMNDSAVEEAACEVCSKKDEIERSDLKKFSEVVMEKPSFRDPSTFTRSTFDCMGCLIAFMPKSSFNRISGPALESAITSGGIENMTVTSKDMGKNILKSAKTAFGKPNGDFSDSELLKMKGALNSFTPDDVDKLPSASLTTDVIKEFDKAIKSDSRPKKSLISKLVDKFKRKAGGLATLLENDMGKELPTDDIQNAPISSFPGLTGDSGESTIKCGSKQAKFLMDKVKRELGDINGTSSNFTLRRISNMKPYLKGFDVSDLKKIEKDNSFSDKVHTIAKADEMSRDQLKTLYDEEKKYSKRDSTDEATFSASVDSTTISNMAPQIVGLHTKAELKKYGSVNCLALVERLSSCDTDKLTRDEIKEKFSFILECKGKTTGTVSSDDLSEAGNMICGMDSSVPDRMDSDALEKHLPTLQKCSLDKSTREKIASNTVSKVFSSDTSTITASGFLVLGNFMSELDDNQLDRMDKEKMSEVADKITKSYDDEEETKTKRRRCGMKMDDSDADKSNFRTKKRKVLKKLVAATESTRAAAISAGRRKRSSTPLTCSDMTSLGASGLSVLTTSQISILQDQDFIDCAELLGSVTDWSDAQKEALVAVAKRSTVWNTPSTWSTTNVYNAGSFVAGLTTAEIDTLSIDLDAISRFGTFSDWSDTKKQAAFTRWLAHSKSSNVGSVTSSELRSLGHMTCAATTAQISSIQSSVYKASADTVGAVTTCSEFQLTEWMNHAKTEYGSDITLWDTATVSNIGIVIGGLTAAEIASLSETQIDSIAASDMSYIPAATFSGFTTAQINTFDASQAQSTTATQRSSLTSAQLAALSSAAGVTFTSSSARGLQGSVLLAVLLSVLVQLLKTH